MECCKFSKAIGGGLLAIALWPSPLCSAAQQPAIAGQSPTFSNSSVYVKVQLSTPLKVSKLKPGNVVEGSLVRDVYSADRELFPAGGRVQLTVDHLEKRRRTADDHWPWVVKVFTPRRQNYPVFKSATVSGMSGESTLQVALISISRRREVHAQAKNKKHGQEAGETAIVEASKTGGKGGSGKSAAPVMVLEAFHLKGPFPSGEGTSSTGPDLSDLEALPAGTDFKILLLGDVSASKSKPGDAVQARLIEPVFLQSRLVLPAGTLFEGKVIKRTPPRWGSRSGSLFLTFTELTLPGGNVVPLAASLTGAELDRGSHTRIDAEGRLRGERPGIAWMAINIGVTAGLAKEVDDGTQLILEALISTATNVSTAGTARIVSSCVSGIFMVSRHGRDVVLPRFTEMDIALDRPLSVKKKADAPQPVAVVHGN